MKKRMIEGWEVTEFESGTVVAADRYELLTIALSGSDVEVNGTTADGLPSRESIPIAVLRAVLAGKIEE
jgi:hypothetical protein